MCTFDTDKIYLTWRRDLDKSRHIVGVIDKCGGSYSFQYFAQNVEKAKEDGFLYYPAFSDIDKVHTESVLETFNRRLVNPQRRDYNDFLRYWCAEDFKGNIFALLGLTGAKLPTDNFEFIAPHPEVPAKFNTEVSWLNKSQDVTNAIKSLAIEEISQKITLKQDRENTFNPKAVEVLFIDERLGFIKSIQCENVFDAIETGRQVNIKIENVIKNGAIKEVLLRIEIE